jgi:hypothetical protein
MHEMDGMLDPLNPGDEELRRRLEAYADERLRPDALATAQTRARVLAQARRSATAAAAPAAAIGGAPGLRRWRPFIGLAAAALALVLLVGGAAAMSEAGGPLYGTRLWLEEVTMPSDPAARAEAELRRIEARFREMEAAAARGDQSAMDAALTEYQSTVDEALGSVPAEMRDEHLQVVLSKHLDVLDGLLKTAPAPAIKGLENAIEKSGKALDRLDDLAPADSPPGGGKPSPKPDASPAGGSGPSPKPDVSPSGGGKPSPKP